MVAFTDLRTCAFALAFAGLAGAPMAFAADNMPATDAATRHDFTRLSQAGAQAFDDVARARLAIFDGQPSKASDLIAAAQTAFDQAATDRTSFIRAEDALNPPPSMRPSTKDANASQPTAWIPVGEGFTLDETLTPSAATNDAVQKANRSLRANQRQQAAEILKVAHVSATATVALAPLNSTQADLRRASQLISAGDYYGASQALRSVQQAVRYDTVVTGGKPTNTQTSPS